MKRARIPQPGEPDALTKTEQGRVERAAARRGVRDRAIVATLLFAGARAGERGRLDAGDVTLTARTGHIRLHGKGDEVRTVPLPPVGREHLAAWLDERGTHDGPLWTGQRGRLTISGITQVVLAVGEDAGIPGLRPHASIETAARYFRAGNAEQAELTIPAPAPREVLTVSASVGVGALTVDLPAGTTARVTSAAGLGGITTPQGDTGGLFRHKQIQIGSGDPQVIIEAGVRIGSVTIRTPGPLNR